MKKVRYHVSKVEAETGKQVSSPSSFLWKEKGVTLLWVSLFLGKKMGRAASASGLYIEEWRRMQKAA